MWGEKGEGAARLPMPEGHILDMKIKMLKNHSMPIALALAIALTACGYHLKGGGLRAPEGVETIAVLVLDNKTAEIGLETRFTGDLAYEFTRSKILRVVDKQSADAILRGSIVSVATNTITHNENFASDERRVTVTLDLIVNRSNGTVVWSNSAFRDSEVYTVTSDKLSTDENKREAIEVISRRLAEKAHNRILQDF